MTFTYQMTVEDAISFQRELIHHTAEHERRRKAWMKYMRAILIAIGYVGTLFFPYRPESTASHVFIAVIVGFLFALLLTPLLNDLYAPYMLRLNRRFLQKSQTWPKETTLQFYETHVEVHSVSTNIHRTTQVPWESIKKVNEDETYRFLYYEEDEALIIPKAKQGISEAEQLEINRTLEKYLSTSPNV